MTSCARSLPLPAVSFHVSFLLGVLLYILQKHELSCYFMDVYSLIWWKLLVICPLPSLGWQVVTIRGWRSPTLWGDKENQFCPWGLCGGGFENFGNVKELAELSELLLYSTQGSFCISPFWAQGMQVSRNDQFWHAFLNFRGLLRGISCQLDSVNCFFPITVQHEHYLTWVDVLWCYLCSTNVISYRCGIFINSMSLIFAIK